MSEEKPGNNRAYFLPGKKLPDTTKEKLRQRRYRARLSSLARFVGPVKALGFVMILVSLSYFSIIQLRHLFFATSYFEIKTIKVIGNSSLSESEIIKTSGVSIALNIFSLDQDAIQQRLLSHAIIK